MSVSSLAIHAAGISAFGIGIIYDTLYLNAPVGDRADPVGRWKFLSFWNMVLQYGYHTFCIFADFKVHDGVDPKKQSQLEMIRDVFYSALAFPFGMFVGMGFWVFYWIDREMTYPAALDEIIPTWENHIVHTLPVVMGFVSLFFVPKKRQSLLVTVPVNVLFMLTYQFWVLGVAEIYGAWAYPMLVDLTNQERMAFFLFLLSWEFSCFLITSKLITIFWGPEAKEKKQKQKPEDRKAKKVKFYKAG